VTRWSRHFGWPRRRILLAAAGREPAAPRTFINVMRDPGGGPYRCPCCSSRTLPTRGGYDLCPVCFWEDDGQDDHDANDVRGGPNGALSLTQARANYAEFGASDRVDLRNVRRPHPVERT
jgi:hypothetical protein